MDGRRYQNTIHHLYRANGLPHIESYANDFEENEQLLDLTSPLMAPLVQLQKQYWDQKGLRQEIRVEALRLIENMVSVEAKAPLSMNDATRLIRIAQALPLFSVPLNCQFLFWQATPEVQTLNKLERVISDREPLVAQNLAVPEVMGL